MTGADLGIILGVIIGGLTGLTAFVTAMFRIARGVAQINTAVNHADPGEPTLHERVIAIEAAQRAHNDRQVVAEATARVRHEENTTTLAALSKDIRSLGARLTRHEHETKPPTRRKGTS